MSSAGPVSVTISGLTNPANVGLIVDAIIVTQGGFASASSPVRLTGVQVSTTTAGAAVRVKISTKASSNIPPGEDIIVKLPGFTLPDSIDKEQILFDGGDPNLSDDVNQGFYGLPASVSVGSESITLSIPIAYPGGDPVTVGVLEGNVYTITFSSGQVSRTRPSRGATGILERPLHPSTIRNWTLPARSKVDPPLVAMW